MLTLFFLTAASAVVDSPQNMDAIKRDIAIIERVFETAFEVNHDRNCDECDELNVSVSGHYLAHQGLLLVVDQDNIFPRIRMPRIAPIRMPRNVNINFNQDIDQDEIDEIVQEAMESAQESMEMAREVFHESFFFDNEDSRREWQTMRNDFEKQMEQVRAKMKTLRETRNKEGNLSEAERKKWQEEMDQARAQMDAASKKYAEKMEVLKKKESEMWNKRQSKFETQIADILCDYGSSIRSIPEDQFITVILREVVYDDEGDRNDKVLVFKKSDLTACRDGKFSKNELLQRATQYTD
ncbi:MAG: hypothetical protein H6510_13425 [Acidobacteria bacterium]|nr:hypothetical protein [Acidobacteriota bacterium]MCB9398807.1 hypothetical protein [Acidobacteriota bacterium]